MTPALPPRLRFGTEESEAASDEWHFNCGPAALCAVLGLKPAEVRPHLGDFEKKGYANPTLIYAALKSLGVEFERKVIIGGGTAKYAMSQYARWPRLGLARIQWAGPWTNPGVPERARYRKTHWVGSYVHSPSPGLVDQHIFDVNAVHVGGWITFQSWAAELVPWILKECVPKANGEWWVTHAVLIKRPEGQ